MNRSEVVRRLIVQNRLFMELSCRSLASKKNTWGGLLNGVGKIDCTPKQLSHSSGVGISSQDPACKALSSSANPSGNMLRILSGTFVNRRDMMMLSSSNWRRPSCLARLEFHTIISHMRTPSANRSVSTTMLSSESFLSALIFSISAG